MVVLGKEALMAIVNVRGGQVVVIGCDGCGGDRIEPVAIDQHQNIHTKTLRKDRMGGVGETGCKQ